MVKSIGRCSRGPEFDFQLSRVGLVPSVVLESRGFFFWPLWATVRYCAFAVLSASSAAGV